MDFQALRREYEDDGIAEHLLPADPLKLFRDWFAIATENCPGQWFEPNAMNLATSDGQGHVTVRVVLLKEITTTGIQFFTNYESAKGQQLAANPRASVNFHWPYLGRQIRLEGPVVKTSRQISQVYFHSRPRGAQIGAIASQQSVPVKSREFLDQLANDLAVKYDGQTIPLPNHWGGYELTIERAEFWQGRSDRLHDRILYRLADTNSWQRERLSP